MAETILTGDDTITGLPPYRNAPTPVVVVNDAGLAIPTSGGGASSSNATTTTSTLVQADGTALAANVDRIAYFIQNLAATAVYVKEGAGASASDFSYILAASPNTNDGKGGSSFSDIYVGIITIAAVTGSPRVIVTEYE